MAARPRGLAWAAALMAALAAAAPVVGQPTAEIVDPDWPCVQRKVPSLTPASVWTGPGIEEAGADWTADAEVAALVRRLSQRRLPVEEAEAEVAAFAVELEPAEREERLTWLFAGLFETMNAERLEIMEGIERYARRQRALADEIRSGAARAGEAETAAADPQEAAAAQDALLGRIRVFEERRASLSYICDVPRLVEQRLFALGRAISDSLEG